MSNLFRIIILILFLPKIALANQSYQDYLIEKSQKLNLSQNSKWLDRVYYEKSKFFNKYESIFDSNYFFLAKNGKKDPKLELEATLRSFFLQKPLNFKNIYGNSQFSQCAFKGRYEWLKKELNFDPKKLKEIKCLDFEKWKKNLNPKSATLIFASSYLNNPASMFGHTFLLINEKGSKDGENILSHAINYSAQTQEMNGVKFAFKGIFGFYKGNFSILKYHKMLKKYTNLENRDIWEYDLNLTDEELDQILMNLWEINNNYANYYFFTENCSYILLKLLKIVRGDVPIRKKLINWVIPSDTVIDVGKAKNLIKNAKFRPSRASKIKHLLYNSDTKMSNFAKKLALNGKNVSKKDNFDSFSNNQQKIIYDLAYEYLQYAYQKDKDFERDKMAKNSLDILKKRSKLTGKTNLKPIKIPKTDPLLAHNPSRIGLKYGHNNIRKDFIKFSWRPAYHDLMDPQSGFLKGAQINLLDFDFNYYTNNEHFELDKFNLLDIKSFSPRNNLFKPLSWQLEIGARNLYISDQDLKLAAFAKFGSGINYSIKKLNSSATFLLNIANYHGKNIDSDNLTALIPEINLITDICDNLKVNLIVKHNFFKQETDFNFTNYELKTNYILSKNLSVNGYFSHENYSDFKDENELGLGFKYFY